MQNKKLAAVEHKANLFLQILLYFNVYLSVIWTFSFGLHVWTNVSALWDFRGGFTVLGYIVATITEAVRLYMGYSGNLRASTGDLSIFLIVSPLIVLPSLLGLILFVRKHMALIAIVTYLLIGIIIIEFLIGIRVWRKQSYHQAKLFQLKLQKSLRQTTNSQGNNTHVSIN